MQVIAHLPTARYSSIAKHVSDLLKSKKYENEKNIKAFYVQTGYTLVEKENGLYYVGSLDLSGCTGITSLPEGLTVGGYLDLEGCTGITNTNTVNKELSSDTRKRINVIRQATNLLQWDWNGKRYIKIDGMFSVLDECKGNVYHVHKICSKERLYIVTDGDGHYAHGKTMQEARADLIYKINDRDLSEYKDLTLDDTLSFEEAIAAYRTITGACSAGTRDYIENRLPKPHKERYSIREVIDLTQGEYESDKFKNFFTKED